MEKMCCFFELTLISSMHEKQHTVLIQFLNRLCNTFLQVLVTALPQKDRTKNHDVFAYECKS